MKLPLLLLSVLAFTYQGKGNIFFSNYISPDSVEFIAEETSIIPLSLVDSNGIAIMSDSLTSSGHKNRKLIAALFAFPLPFGIFGGHRLYFGTKPYMPFVYIATLGGCFGILPLIDFIAILVSDKESFEKFNNNPRVFMWSH